MTSLHMREVCMWKITFSRKRLFSKTNNIMHELYSVIKGEYRSTHKSNAWPFQKYLYCMIIVNSSHIHLSFIYPELLLSSIRDVAYFSQKIIKRKSIRHTYINRIFWIWLQLFYGHSYINTSIYKSSIRHTYTNRIFPDLTQTI